MTTVSLRRLVFTMIIATGVLPMGAVAAQEPVASEVKLDTGSGTLVGSLLVPAGPAPVPVALIIAGSGPTDRNGNSAALPGPNNSLRMLADMLAAGGIASLRYDKRGIAGSAGAFRSEAELRFDTYVDDAAKWATQLRADPRFSTITIIGHSEGSLIGMIAARKAGADGYVSISGPARGAADVLRDQLPSFLPADVVPLADSMISELEAGRTWPDPPQSLAGIFRPSVQPYIISWFRYRPSDELARLTIPVLVIQGTTDIQVAVTEATALHAAKPGGQLEIVEGMNHVMKQVPSDREKQVASYSDSTLALAPRLGQVIVPFIRSVPRHPGD